VRERERERERARELLKFNIYLPLLCKDVLISETYIPSPGKLVPNEIHFILRNQRRNFFEKFCFDAVSRRPGKTSCITGTRILI
jgi:hypothetical protein